MLQPIISTPRRRRRAASTAASPILLILLALVLVPTVAAMDSDTATKVGTFTILGVFVIIALVTVILWVRRSSARKGRLVVRREDGVVLIDPGNEGDYDDEAGPNARRPLFDASGRPRDQRSPSPTWSANPEFNASMAEIAGGAGRPGSLLGAGPRQLPHGVSEEDAERYFNSHPGSQDSYDLAMAFERGNPYQTQPVSLTPEERAWIVAQGVSAWRFEPNPLASVRQLEPTVVEFTGKESCIQTNLPVPRAKLVYYYEVKIVKKDPSAIVSVGWATQPYPWWRLTGYSRYSIGYHSKEGLIYRNHPFTPLANIDEYNEGDVIGCGFRHRSGKVFFTRNGELMGILNARMFYTVYPTVSADGPCVLQANFGLSEFLLPHANVRQWGFANPEDTRPPPPAYGQDQDTFVVEVAGPPTPPPGIGSATDSPVMGPLGSPEEQWARALSPDLLPALRSLVSNNVTPRGSMDVATTGNASSRAGDSGAGVPTPESIARILLAESPEIELEEIKPTGESPSSPAMVVAVTSPEVHPAIVAERPLSAQSFHDIEIPANPYRIEPYRPFPPPDEAVSLALSPPATSDEGNGSAQDEEAGATSNAAPSVPRPAALTWDHQEFSRAVDEKLRSRRGNRASPSVSQRSLVSGDAGAPGSDAAATIVSSAGMPRRHSHEDELVVNPFRISDTFYLRRGSADIEAAAARSNRRRDRRNNHSAQNDPWPASTAPGRRNAGSSRTAANRHRAASAAASTNPNRRSLGSFARRPLGAITRRVQRLVGGSNRSSTHEDLIAPSTGSGSSSGSAVGAAQINTTSPAYAPANHGASGPLQGGSYPLTALPPAATGTAHHSRRNSQVYLPVATSYAGGSRDTLPSQQSADEHSAPSIGAGSAGPTAPSLNHTESYRRTHPHEIALAGSIMPDILNHYNMSGLASTTTVHRAGSTSSSTHSRRRSSLVAGNSSGSNIGASATVAGPAIVAALAAAAGEVPPSQRNSMLVGSTAQHNLDIFSAVTSSHPHLLSSSSSDRPSESTGSATAAGDIAHLQQVSASIQSEPPPAYSPSSAFPGATTTTIAAHESVSNASVLSADGGDGTGSSASILSSTSSTTPPSSRPPSWTPPQRLSRDLAQRNSRAIVPSPLSNMTRFTPGPQSPAR
ncbi:Protein ssh4 [Tieghemiomyces parasiticus]|uniref:Protein ssh4 n=1 Tax=Tieghemiomyces parasiticus TaxID=78921 RepID=A0A9W8ACP3_9FUNG|nr:Protein ssh4 [Tieghemiomyces parasiticus]